jgi:hypothetical protein
MEAIKKYKYMTFICLALLVLSVLYIGLLLFAYNLSNDKNNFLNELKEDRLHAANSEMNNLVSLLVGKVSKQDVIKYYESIGKTISEEEGNIIYFEGLGYQFNKDEMLVKVYPRIIGFKQYMPNPPFNK